MSVCYYRYTFTFHLYFTYISFTFLWAAEDAKMFLNLWMMIPSCTRICWCEMCKRHCH